MSNANLGKVLKRVRILKDLTITELSDRCGYSKGYISAIENNERTPNFDVIEKIFSSLDLSLSEAMLLIAYKGLPDNIKAQLKPIINDILADITDI